MGSGMDSCDCDYCGEYRCNCPAEKERQRVMRAKKAARDDAEWFLLQKYQTELKELMDRYFNEYLSGERKLNYE